MALNHENFWSNLLTNVDIADDIKMNHPKKLEDEIMELLKKKFPTSTICVYSFGSRIMGIADRDSDLDIYVQIGNFYDYTGNRPNLELQEGIASAFYNQPEWRVRAIHRGGYCPIVLLRYLPLNLNIDISFSNGMTVKQNQMVQYLFELQPVARYMVIFLRKWIKSKDLSKGFRSHILILMVIFLLQVKNHLPGIDKLQENLKPTEGPWVESFNKLELSKFSMEKIKVDEVQTQRMLREFFIFYATFNFKGYVVCTYLGKMVTRSSLRSKMPERYITHNQTLRHPALIQDFMNFNDNKGRKIFHRELNSLKSFLSDDYLSSL